MHPVVFWTLWSITMVILMGCFFFWVWFLFHITGIKP